MTDIATLNQVLQHKVIGEGSPVMILHGLFGTMDNWRTFAGMLKDHYQVILVDLRNHGRSFWSDEYDYNILAEDLHNLLNHLEISQIDIIGHSMGGKAALTFAVNYPDLLNKLAVIDIGIKQYAPGHLNIFNAVLGMDLANLSSRSEADEILSEHIGDMAIRQFILKSLGRSSDGGFRWKTNFRSLFTNYDRILSAIDIDLIETSSLFVRGLKSEYITNQDIDLIRDHFDSVRIADIDAGHWIHSEKPKELFDELHHFLTDNGQG